MARAERAMQRLGVAHLAGQAAVTLSAGEAQRVSIARAIVTGPELLLLDEPLANMDPEAVPMVQDLVKELADAGITVIMATHILEQAYAYVDNVIRLERGRLVPPVVENLLSGKVEEAEDGPVLVLEHGLRISVVTDKRGPVRAAVDPGDIVVSIGPFESSARNSLRGRIIALKECNDFVFVTLDAGAPFTSSVTRASCTRLKLTVGADVVFTFKATAVTVF